VYSCSAENRKAKRELAHAFTSFVRVDGTHLDRELVVSGAGQRGHFFAPSFASSSPSLSLLLQSRRTVLAVKGPLRFTAPNNGALLTAPGRSELHLLIREKGSFWKAAGNLGAKGAKMAPFFTATDKLVRARISITNQLVRP
jgi:hypothetical protein